MPGNQVRVILFNCIMVALVFTWTQITCHIHHRERVKLEVSVDSAPFVVYLIEYHITIKHASNCKQGNKMNSSGPLSHNYEMLGMRLYH